MSSRSHEDWCSVASPIRAIVAGDRPDTRFTRRRAAEWTRRDEALALVQTDADLARDVRVLVSIATSRQGGTYPLAVLCAAVTPSINSTPTDRKNGEFDSSDPAALSSIAMADLLKML